MKAPMETAPVMDLSPRDLDKLVAALREYHAMGSPLFQRCEQREGAEKVPAWPVAGDCASVDRADGPGLGRRQGQGGAHAAMVHQCRGLGR